MATVLQMERPRTGVPRTQRSLARPQLGWVVSAPAVLFLLVDGALKVVQLDAVVAASAELGFTAGQTFALGVLLMACLLTYVLPRTASLGAVLLSGYLGGAMAIHLQLGSSVASVAFPVVLGVLVWAGLMLRDRRVGGLLC